MIRFHFDYFAIDFKEEFSALYGGSLQNQSAFVSKSIQHILSLYKEDVPKSVVLIGHSIGGLVSLSALKDQNIKGKVNTIINLATPHQPVIVADYDIRWVKIGIFCSMKYRFYVIVSHKYKQRLIETFH